MAPHFATSGGSGLLRMLAIAFVALTVSASVANAAVSYDHRSLVINGHRRILIFGSIHYPRSTPEMWPGLIQKAKDGGLDVVQTYVFWNGHEPVKGQYYFSDRYDLVRFCRYHVPRSWLKPGGHLLVVLEEYGGDLSGVALATRTT